MGMPLTGTQLARVLREEASGQHDSSLDTELSPEVHRQAKQDYGPGGVYYNGVYVSLAGITTAQKDRLVHMYPTPQVWAASMGFYNWYTFPTSWVDLFGIIGA